MTIETRLAEIRARVEAATEGPWRWRNTSAPYLEGQRTRVVMAFRRMGMNGAQPVFRDADNVLQDGGRANLYGFPDAEFIAASRTDLPALLAAVEDVMEKLPSLLEAAWDDGNALGLDGWTGPERGEEPDEHAIHRRARLRSKLVDEAYEAITAALGGDRG